MAKQTPPDNAAAGAPHMFDRALIARRQARAAPDYGRHDVLKRVAAREIADRLGAVNRRFALALDLGGHDGTLARALMAGGQVDQVVTAGPALPLLRHAPPPRVVADEERLPFGDGVFDFVASALALHQVNDLVGTLIQIRRALRPDGLFLGALFGGDTLHELRAAIMTAEAEVEGGVSPRVAPFADVRTLGALLQRAGFALPVADADRLTLRYDNAMALMADLRGMGESNALNERRRSFLRRKTFLRACEIYAERFSDADGRVRASFDIIYLAGWSPHESQQQPLRPGSARARLADALNTEEKGAGEKAGPEQR